VSQALLLIHFTGDVGGQKTLRSYWRNYFEKTDALIWVVDATDRLRVEDCRGELHGLLQEEVSLPRRISIEF
jgi:ADP-ribosylation factor-like protein 2